MRIEHPSLKSWTFALRGFQIYRFLKDKWPAFMFEDPLSRRLWPWLYIRFPRYQFVMFNGRRMIAAANSVPIHVAGELSELPDTGWTWAIQKAFADRKEGRAPNTQVMLSIVVAEEARAKGFSTKMIETVKAIGKREGMRFALAPVRPSRKSEFPMMAMDEYVRKQTDDGRIFDPWLRAHVGAGGKILSVCHRSMTIPGSIKTWSRWAHRSFTQSGSFVVEGALTPITIELEKDRGTYVEPNVWVLHEYGATQGNG
jgi:GNAT superfamily N-acetyltransferase